LSLGEWSAVVREVADYDLDRAERIARTWPVDDVLHAYLDRLRRTAVEEHRNALVVWASLAPHLKKRTPPPATPAILKDSD
jgi:hypothetical protein